MNGRKITLSVACLFLALGICLPGSAAAEQNKYMTVQLDVEGKTFNLSAAQTVPREQWSRFHLAFGDGRSQINTAHESDLDAPPPIRFEHDGQIPKFSASVSVQFIRSGEDAHKVKIIIQTAARGEDRPGDDGDWIFTREEDNTLVAVDRPYIFTMVDGSSGEELTCSLTIAGDNNPYRAAKAIDPERILDVALEIRYQLRNMRGNVAEKLVDKTQQAGVAKKAEERETEFRDVVPLPDGDSCYHFVTVTLAKAGFTQGANRLLGTLKIDLETVFGSDSPLDASRFYADIIRLDDFTKELRLRNGKPVEIRIFNETSHFPFPAEESFKITARW